MAGKIKPTILVVMGITGDLAAKKIIPSLFSLYVNGLLPSKFRLVGFGRKTFSADQFREYIRNKAKARVSGYTDKQLNEFLRLVTYQQGLFDNEDSYKSLKRVLEQIERKWRSRAQHLYYLAVPPSLFGSIFGKFKSTAIVRHGSSLLVEKPFGSNEQTARELDKLLEELFAEDRIYRIDHYLAKPMLENILPIRFANQEFEPIWNKDYITKIEIRVWETIGVEHRGPFYDGLGALMDVGQNHLLLMLALVTMQKPKSLIPKHIQQARAGILSALKPVDVAKDTFRAQYRGYKTIPGVAKNSKKETYYKLKAYLDHPAWKNVPITMESGKRMPEDRTDIHIHFEDGNKIIFSVEPEEGVFVEFWTSKKGLVPGIEKRRMEFTFRDVSERVQYVEEYEKLLLDSMIGDQTLFISPEEVYAMWRFVDPIIEAWEKNKVPLKIYRPDTWEAVKYARIK